MVRPRPAAPAARPGRLGPRTLPGPARAAAAGPRGPGQAPARVLRYRRADASGGRPPATVTDTENAGSYCGPKKLQARGRPFITRLSLPEMW